MRKLVFILLSFIFSSVNAQIFTSGSAVVLASGQSLLYKPVIIPDSLSCDTSTSTSVKAVWRSISGASTYQLRYRESGDLSWIVISGIATNYKTITGLTAFKYYDIQVRSCFANGDTSAYSVTIVCNTDFSPTDIAGLKLWLKSDAGITKDGSNYVSSWADQSGSGNDVTQANGSYQPLWVASQINGYPAIRYDGSNDVLTKTGFDLSGTDDITVVAVHKLTSSSGSNRILVSLGTYASSGNFTIYYSDAHQMDCYGNIGIAYEKFAYTFGSYNTTINTFDMSTTPYDELKAYVNGSAQTPIATTNGTNSVNFQNGLLYIGAFSGGSSWDTDLITILIYDSKLSTTNRQLLEQYLQNYYAHY